MRSATRWARRCGECQERVGLFSVRCRICYAPRRGRAVAALLLIGPPIVGAALLILALMRFAG